MTWLYIQSEAGNGRDAFALYTVGFYRPDGRWEPESDHITADSAARRVHYLNGGKDNARSQDRSSAEGAKRA